MGDSLPAKSHLERLVTTHSRDTGIAVARLRRWISTMVLLGAFGRVRHDESRASFVVKGGVAMELRLGTQARTTNDVDVTFYGDPARLAEAITEAFSTSMSGFDIEASTPIPIGKTGAVRVTVRLAYQHKPWATIDIELAVANQPAHLEFVPGIDIDHFGLNGPDRVAALPVSYQIAQKLHAVSQRFAVGDNKRVRDIVDILLLRGIAADLTELHAACVDVFFTRALQSWPPSITVYDSWQAEHERLCKLIGFATTDVYAAVDEVHELITQIDAAGPPSATDKL